MPDPVMTLERVSKYYEVKNGGELLAVKDVSLAVLPEEFICILGPTASGKSTLLKMMGGIEKPTLGSMTLRGETFTDGIPSSRLKNFGFVFQQDNLLPWRTVVKNLNLPLEIFHAAGSGSRGRIEEMLTLVGLQDYGMVYPHELSGGMRQRVSLARAMMHDPDILLMDQPLGALDAITRKMLAYELLRISRVTRKTMVMVTNNIEEALLLANRVLVFTNLPGEIAYEVKNDIPVEARTESLPDNARYRELRALLDDFVHVQSESARMNKRRAGSK